MKRVVLHFLFETTLNHTDVKDECHRFAMEGAISSDMPPLFVINH